MTQTKYWEYTVNDMHGWRESVNAPTQGEALKLAFAKNKGARIYPVGGKWGVEIVPQSIAID